MKEALYGMETILLASASPRRKELLQKAGIPFDAVPSNAEELPPEGVSPEELVKENALRKAKEVSSRFPGRLVLGADTLVAVGDRVLGKPKDREDAKAMLRSLSGRAHRVLTGVALTDGSRTQAETEETVVFFRELPEALIESYVSTGECDDKAGAYGIQGRGCILAERIEGDYCCVVGLPMCRVHRMLERFCYELPIDSGSGKDYNSYNK